MRHSNTTGGSRRPKWLNAYRLYTTIALTFVTAAIGVLLYQSKTTTPEPPTQVEMATEYLEAAGFDSPVYLGITPGTEAEFPTFQATAIGGESVKLFLRTTPSGAWEIQPDGIFESVTSADEFAEIAYEAVHAWENMPSEIQPSTDGSYGEYEQRKYMYELLARYNPADSYWDTVPNETDGWSRTPSK